MDLHDRVVGRYLEVGTRAASDVTASDVTTRKLIPLADAIDAMEKAGKKATKALEALTKHVESSVEGEDFQARVKGLDAYAPMQQVEEMGKQLEAAVKAINSLAEEYDFAAKSMARLGV
jgi:hypothetical protein